MNGMGFGKLIMFMGAGLVLIGALIVILSKFINLGQLPGDIHIEGANGSFYFPVVSCIVLSIVLSVIMNLFHR